MGKAKAAVSDFLSRDGMHETTVHETVNPAVENERLIRTEQENVQKAVDREVHQNHYHFVTKLCCLRFAKSANA